MGMAWMIALFWQQAITDTIKAFVPVSGAWPYEIGVAILTTLIGAGVVYLFKQNLRINNYAVTYAANLSFVQYPRRKKVKDIFLIPGNYGVAGIVAALIAHDIVHHLAQYIDNLALALITPLRAY